MQLWRVRDVMSTDVVGVDEDTPVTDITGLMNARRVDTVPVVDKAHRVVGVISRTDLRSVDSATHPNGGPAAPGGRHDLVCARELMSLPAWTVDVDASLSTAAQRMYLRRVRRLPVTGDAGRLVGIVSSTDLLRVFGRLDTEIRHDVIEQVLRRTMRVNPKRVHVAVENGTVTLAGTIDRRTTVAAVERLTYTVPGVVSVVNRLSYTYDDTHFVDDDMAAVGSVGSAAMHLPDWSSTAVGM